MEMEIKHPDPLARKSHPLNVKISLARLIVMSLLSTCCSANQNVQFSATSEQMSLVFLMASPDYNTPTTEPSAEPTAAPTSHAISYSNNAASFALSSFSGPLGSIMLPSSNADSHGMPSLAPTPFSAPGMFSSSALASSPSASTSFSAPYSELVFSAAHFTSQLYSHSSPHSTSASPPTPQFSVVMSNHPGYSVEQPPTGQSHSHGYSSHQHSQSDQQLSAYSYSVSANDVSGAYSTFSEIVFSAPDSAYPPSASFSTASSLHPGDSIHPPTGQSYSHSGSAAAPLSQPTSFSIAMSFSPGYSVAPPTGESHSQQQHSQSGTISSLQSVDQQFSFASFPDPTISFSGLFSELVFSTPDAHASSTRSASASLATSLPPPPPLSAAVSFNPGYSVAPPTGESHSHGHSFGHLQSLSHSGTGSAVQSVSHALSSFHSTSTSAGGSSSGQFSEFVFSTSVSHGSGSLSVSVSQETSSPPPPPPPPPFSAALSFNPGYSVAPPTGPSHSHGHSFGYSQSLSHLDTGSSVQSVSHALSSFHNSALSSAGGSSSGQFSKFVFSISVSHASNALSVSMSQATSLPPPPPPFSAALSFNPGYSVAPPTGQSHSHGHSFGYSQSLSHLDIGSSVQSVSHALSSFYNSALSSAGGSSSGQFSKFVFSISVSHGSGSLGTSVSQGTSSPPPPPPPFSAALSFNPGYSVAPPIGESHSFGHSQSLSHSGVGSSVQSVSHALSSFHNSEFVFTTSVAHALSALSVSASQGTSLPPPPPPFSVAVSFNPGYSVAPPTGESHSHGHSSGHFSSAVGSTAESSAHYSSITSVVGSISSSSEPLSQLVFSAADSHSHAHSVSQSVAPPLSALSFGPGYSFVPPTGQSHSHSASYGSSGPQPPPPPPFSAGPSFDPGYSVTPPAGGSQSNVHSRVDSSLVSHGSSQGTSLVPPPPPFSSGASFHPGYSFEPPTMESHSHEYQSSVLHSQSHSMSPGSLPLHESFSVAFSFQPGHSAVSHSSALPTVWPTVVPSAIPSTIPSATTSMIPSTVPSVIPSTDPSVIPSTVPSAIPSAVPSVIPSAVPSAVPSADPSAIPSAVLSAIPSADTSVIPSTVPSAIPSAGSSVIPSAVPSAIPSAHLTVAPSAIPSVLPSMYPSTEPSVIPSEGPTTILTVHPSAIPSFTPSAIPSAVPSATPSINPTAVPSEIPSIIPTTHPSGQPSPVPSVIPTTDPSVVPSAVPMINPSQDPTAIPSPLPSCMPSISPSVVPTIIPSPVPSCSPTVLPTTAPTIAPSCNPSVTPTAVPTEAPTQTPTILPTPAPTVVPSTASPSTVRPSADPTTRPTPVPTVNGQTFKPTVRPSAAPTYDLNFAPHSTYKQFEAQSAAYVAVPNSYTFSTYWYKGQMVTGTCNAWSSFTSNNLQLPFDDLEFTSLSMYASFFDFPTGVKLNTTATCSSATELTGIVTSLQRSTAYSVACGGRTWKVFQCSAANILCVDCDGKCDSSTTCPGSAYVVNTCGTCTASNKAAAAVVNAVYAQKILYPEFSAVPVVNTTRTTATATVTVSAAGTIYCSALRPTATLVTVMQIKNTGAKMIAGAAGTISVTMTNLGPDTAYNVYCYSEDFAAHVMPLSVASASKVAITTDCCRSVHFSKTHSSIVQYVSTSSRPEQQFSFLLDSTPNSALTAAVSLAKVDCTTLEVTSVVVSDITILPSTFAFSDASTSLSGTFILRASGFTGCYAVTVATSGSDAYTSVKTVFQLQSATSPPSVPVLSKVAFSDSGTALLFSFDSSTDRGSTKISSFASTFNCSMIVRFTGSNNAVCKWVTTSQLSATLATAGPLVEIGQNTTLLGNMVRAACVANTVCANYEYMASDVNNIAKPDNALQPSVSLSTSTSVSPCGDIKLDPTLSTGFGGRDWEAVEWSVTGSSIAQKTVEIASLLNNNFQDTFSVAKIPNSYLTRSTGAADSTYSITLKLTNFLQLSAIATVTVKVNAEGSSIIPSIILSGTKDIVYRWQPLSVFASVTWPSCASNATKALPITYSWKLFQGTALTTLTSSSLDKRFFKLPTYSLEASTMYLISVTAAVTTADGDVISSYVSSNLQTGQSGVRAVISGASERTGSTLDTVVIDGSTSQDVDYPTTGILSYTWACKVYAPVFGGACVGFVASTTSKQTINAGAVDAQTYTISLIVSNSAEKTESASILLTMLENRLPSIVVSDPKTKYNPDDKITLGATITPSVGNAFGTWSSSSVSSLETIAATPITKNFGRGSSFLYQLVISSGSLTAGLSYTFQISAYYTSNSANIATGSITIVMNAPPAGGSLAVTPSVGTALTQVFLLQTSRWNDDAADLPLSYVLSSYTVKPTKLNSIKASDAVSYAETKLGQGLADNNYLVYCVATASDIYGSSASTITSVTVNPPASTDAVVDATSSSIDSALSNGDPSGVQQAVDGALSSMNSVNCTVPTECGSLHREKCSETAKTCGPCLAGYVGPAGDSNKACKVKKGSRMQKLDPSSKACPSDCSQQGTCVFYDLYGFVISNCTVTEPLCRAKCVCNPNFHGKSCSLGQTEYQQYLGLREKLCVSIYKTTKLQDVTADVVSARALSISNILLDINQISDAALGNCTAALVETVTKYPALSCQGTSFDQISTALSNILEKGNEMPEDLLVDVGAALTALTEGCQTGQSVGEDPVTLSTANVNLLAAVSDKASLDGTIIDAPQSDYDTENGITPVTVQVNTSSLGDADTVAITVFQYTNNPNALVTNSSKVSVLTTSDGDAASTPGVTLVLQNNEPIDYKSSVADSNAIVHCMRYESAPYLANVTCSNGMAVNLTCPAFLKGSYNVTCPSVVQIPQCKTFNGAEFVVNPLCKVTAFDAYSTTCFCQGSVTRRYLASGEAVATEFSSSFVAIATDFATTFTTAPTLTDVQNNPVILSTLAGFVGTFLVGMYFFMRWDRIDAELYHKNLLKESKKKAKVRRVFQFFDSIFPDELRAGTWFQIFVEQLRSDHFLVRLFVTNEKDKSLRSVFWSCAMGKLVAFLFMNSLVASTMYPDDGYCEEFAGRHACVSAKTTGGMFDACKWNDENASCEFNPPQIDFLTSIIITLIVTMLTVPLDKLIDANVQLIAQYFHYTELERKIAIDDRPAEGILMRKFDEFTLTQTQRSTILRAARLDKARAHMDFVPPEEEARIVAAYANKTTALPSSKNVASVLTSVLAQINFKQYRYSIDHVKPKALIKRVADARTEADTMFQEMEVMDSTEEQEKYLMRQFIVNAFPVIQRGVVSKYFLKDYSLKRTDYIKNKEMAAFVFLPCLLGFLIYYVYVFNLSIGSRATNMWLAVTFIGLAQDILLLQPMKVLINFLVINGNVSREVRQLCERLTVRSKLIMMRTHGMMRDADALIQHFNPACRVARMYPSLPISRLLMSLNDHDLPQRELPHPTLIPWAYFSTGVVALMLLPDVLQETALDISAGAISDFGLIALYFFAKANMPAMIVIIVVGVASLVAYTVWHSHQKHRERFHVAVKYAVTAEDVEDHETNDSNLPCGDSDVDAVARNLEAGLSTKLSEGDSQRDFGSIWSLNRNKPNSMKGGSRSIRNLGTTEAMYAPPIIRIKPENNTQSVGAHSVSTIAVLAEDDDGPEPLSLSMRSHETYKPAPQAGTFPTRAMLHEEDADACLAPNEVHEDTALPLSRSHLYQSSKVNGDAASQLLMKPASSPNVRLEPLERREIVSRPSTGPFQAKRKRKKVTKRAPVAHANPKSQRIRALPRPNGAHLDT